MLPGLDLSAKFQYRYLSEVPSDVFLTTSLRADFAKDISYCNTVNRSWAVKHSCSHQNWCITLGNLL